MFNVNINALKHENITNISQVQCGFRKNGQLCTGVVRHQIYNCDSHDEYLIICDDCVKWYSNNDIVAVYRPGSPVIQAVWCRFAVYTSQSYERYLIVLCRTRLYAYSTQGDRYVVYLPCRASRVWPLNEGLLLERARADNEVSGTSAVTMFSLLHPLEELKPLCMYDAYNANNELMGDPNEYIVYVSTQEPLLVTYHAQSGIHTCWLLRQSRDEVSKRQQSMTGEALESSHVDSHPRRSSIIDDSAMLSNNNSGLLAKTMCLGIDEDNGQPAIVAEFALDRLWRKDHRVLPVSSSVFMATDLDGKLALCFFSKSDGSVRSWSSNVDDILSTQGPQDAETLFELHDVECALPLFMTNSCDDVFSSNNTSSSSERNETIVNVNDGLVVPDVIVVLHHDRTLALYMGGSRVTDVRVPECCTPVVGIADACANRFTLIKEDGTRYRVSVPSISESPIVNACFGAWRFSLDSRLYLCLLKHFFGNRDSSLSGGGGGGSGWSQFTKWIEEFVANMCSERQVSLLLNTLRDQLCICLSILHLVYEDMKLNTLLYEKMCALGVLLSKLNALVGRHIYVRYYTRDFGQECEFACTNTLKFDDASAFEWRQQPADLLKWCLLTLRGETLEPFPYIHPNTTLALLKVRVSPCKRTKQLCRFYSLIRAHHAGNRHVDVSMRDASPSLPLLATPFSPVPSSGVRAKYDHSDFPVFTPSPLRSFVGCGAASNAIEELILDMVRENFDQIALKSLPFGVALPLQEAIKSSRLSPPLKWPSAAYELVGREDIVHLMKSAKLPYLEDSDVHDFSLLEDPEAQRTWHDVMAQAIRRATYRFGRDMRVEEVVRLLRSDRRVCVQVSDSLTDQNRHRAELERLFILSQRILAQSIGRGMFTLGSVRPVSTDILQMPDLVLKGRVSPGNTEIELDDDTLIQTLGQEAAASFTNWPEFHNGAATGLGIVSQRGLITRTWIVYNRPSTLTHTHAGLLLALGLLGHLSVLKPADFYWYLSQNHTPTTIAVLLGIATAKRGTMDTIASKILCLHIPALVPPSFCDVGIPLLVQSAAILGVGFVYQESAHRLISEVLVAEIGRPPLNDDDTTRESYSLAAGLALGLVVLGRGDDAVGLKDLRIEDKLMEFVLGGRRNHTKSLHSHVPNTSTVLDGDLVNVEVTAPGATLAVGLMYLKCESSRVAARLVIPNTHSLLRGVRPDLIILRVIGRNLILWSQIKPTKEWITSLIPSMMKENVEKSVEDGVDSSADMYAIAYAYCSIVIGACFSIGLKYAGSQSAQATTVLTDYVEWFVRLRKRGGFNLNVRVDRYVSDLGVSMACLSLSLVVAGSGHLPSFKLIRQCRTFLDREVSYGTHMALHMALGFLFLGGGRYTLGTSNTAVASLVCSLFPRFPWISSDNRYHLQAFRHLYVLAVEQRCIETRDVETGKQCYIPLEVVLKGDVSCQYGPTVLNMVSPCLVPEFDRITSIKVNTNRYWEVAIDMTSTSSPHKRAVERHRVIFVKRKTGFLSYDDDPMGLRSILARTFPKGHTATAAQKVTFVRALSADPHLVSFANYFCSENNEVGRFCTDVLYECLTMEKPEMIQVYMKIRKVLSTLSKRHHTIDVANMKLISAFYESAPARNNGAFVPLSERSLLQPEFTVQVEFRLRHFYAHQYDESVILSKLQEYLNTGTFPQPPPSVDQGTWSMFFAGFLCFMEIPDISTIRQIAQAPSSVLELCERMPTLPSETLLYLYKALKQ